MKGKYNMIIIKDNKDILNLKKGDKIKDERPNKEVDLETRRASDEYTNDVNKQQNK
tara:strand:- start:37 stop:204 length:168 start_codon:yes stop_codon:yes gene_type:complete